MDLTAHKFEYLYAVRSIEWENVMDLNSVKSYMVSLDWIQVLKFDWLLIYFDDLARAVINIEMSFQVMWSNEVI